MSLLQLFRKGPASIAGSAGATAVAPLLPSFEVSGTLVRPASANPYFDGPRELHRADSLEQFHQLLRKHRLDRIHLDLVEIAPALSSNGKPTYSVVLSASNGQADIIGLLPFLGEKGPAHPASEREAHSYLDVLQSRFLFLGYTTCAGLASLRLVDALPSGRRAQPARRNRPPDYSPGDRSATEASRAVASEASVSR